MLWNCVDDKNQIHTFSFRLKIILPFLFLWPVFALTAVSINAITRNHSVIAETILLAENSSAKLPIVISEKASKDTKVRVVELASYLEQITGAKFEIKTGLDVPGILVGTITEFSTPSASEGLKIYNIYDVRNSYVIRTEGGCVKLLGATEFGVSHAVSRFLELLGCRWFFPGPTWASWLETLVGRSGCFGNGCGCDGKLKPGDNIVAVRVWNNTEIAGLFCRVFLWSPKK